MKRITAALAIVIALSISACAQLGSFDNPIGRNELVNAKATYGVVLTAAVAYRDLCDKKVIARPTCAPVVAKLQAADRHVQKQLKNLSEFTIAHPTITPASLITAVKDAVDDFKSVADANGVK